jgi:hypothetical protein
MNSKKITLELNAKNSVDKTKPEDFSINRPEKKNSEKLNLHVKLYKEDGQTSVSSRDYRVDENEDDIDEPGPVLETFKLVAKESGPMIITNIFFQLVN